MAISKLLLKPALVLLASVSIFTLTGNRVIYGRGDSMLPTIDSNSIVLCFNKRDYDVGDVVYFKISGNSVVHRIVVKYVSGDVTYYETKGDGNESKDKYPIYEENIICKVNVN